MGEMGNIAEKLSGIAKDNCAVTFSLNPGREFPQSIAPSVGLLPGVRQPRKSLLQAAVNNDLTDCVEVFTPFSAFGHLGNGEGLFRHYRSAKSLFQPYFGSEEPSPLMLQAILQGLEEFQEKMSFECTDKFKDCKEPESCELGRKKCLESIRLEEGRNAEFEGYVQRALDKIKIEYEAAGNSLQPSF